jgi:hypothetical protein
MLFGQNEELEEAAQPRASGGNPPGPPSAESEEGHLLDFLTDGLNMLVRTAVLQVRACRSHFSF